MAVPDPDEQDRRDVGRHDAADNTTDATFAGIIAQWRAEPDAPRWPTVDDRTHEVREVPPAASAGKPSRDDAEDDHFEPPEPPPLPVPRPRTLGGLLLLAAGVLLLTQPSLLSVSEGVGTPLGLLAVTAGIGWLVLGLRGGPPQDGWDDGARL